MLSLPLAAVPRALGALAAARGLVTSAATGSGHQAPTYTYASPGTSMTEPSYLGGAGGSVASMEEHAARPSPAKKARQLKVLSSKTRKLTAQGGGGMLPPGCSISDPHYSLSDPVYFVDNDAGTKAAH